MATCSSFLACKILWAEEPGGYNPWGCKESVITECVHAHTHTHTHTFYLLFLLSLSVVLIRKWESESMYKSSAFTAYFCFNK